VLGDAVGYRVSRAASRPLRDRVRKVLADHALERGNLARFVQLAKQVVERTVLEHDHDDVVKRILMFRCFE
jgi:hypothetical protein